MKKPLSENHKKRPKKEANSITLGVIVEEQFSRDSIEQNWKDLNALLPQIVRKCRKNPHAIKHMVLWDTVLRIVKLVQAGVMSGEDNRILLSLIAAESFAAEIKRAHEMYPEKLKHFAEKLPVVTVTITPNAVAVDETQERKELRLFMDALGVGMKSNEATGRRVFTPTPWKKLAVMALEKIQCAQQSKRLMGSTLLDHILKKWASENRDILPEVADLPPFSESLISPWWAVARKIVKSYWNENPQVMKDCMLEAERNSGRPEGEKPQTFALKKVNEAFRRLAKNQR